MTIGFVDVPGHERFVRNMLCGVAGIDFVLLIVAADDGVDAADARAPGDPRSPRRRAAAPSPSPRSTASRPSACDAVARESRALLAGTALAGAPVFPVSAVTGAGIDALKAHLADAARAAPPRAPHGGNFRLAIDRAFTIAGAGLVVTGTVFTGAVAVGDPVRVLRPGAPRACARIHAQNAAADSGPRRRALRAQSRRARSRSSSRSRAATGS